VKSPVPAGLHSLQVREQRDTQVYIPEAASKFKKAPLVLSLHGATQGADRGISLLRAQADEIGFIIVAPASEETTWEIEGAWGADRNNVDQSLALSFGLRDIDPARIAIAGFSDGASYSLSLGLTNGDLFNAVLGFSAGYIANGPRTGKPPVFLSHGTQDPIFPIDVTGRLLERTLKDNGYAVTFRQFEGRHTLPPDVASAAMHWMMAAAPLPAHAERTEQAAPVHVVR
jgi:predicted esterase